MRKIWITKKETRDWKFYLKHLNITFLLLSTFSLSIFAIYANVTRIIFSPNKLDIVTENLHDIALYFQYFDTDVRDFLLTIDDVAQAYSNGQNIFEEKKDEIEYVLQYIKTNKDYLLQVWFKKYTKLAEVIIESLEHKDELYTLLWKHGEQNYLILLQNSAEKRPNGWFFWSFAFVSIEYWFIKELEIIDAYYPKRINPDVRVPVADWAQGILWTDTVWFISSNKFWFSSTDGHNIKTLYDLTFNDPQGYTKKKDVIETWLFEKTFNKKIKWVIFLRSDFLTYLLPNLQPLLHEWQFVNASIDLIRGENLPDKKAIYKKELTEFFDKNKGELAKKFIKNFEEVISYNYINIYIENANKKFKQFLKKNKLTTNYEKTNIYAWDNNSSYNKVDTFVTKNVAIIDPQWNKIFLTDKDVIPIDQLQKGVTYQMNIAYRLAIPQDYIEFIYSLQEKYDIEIGSREKWILAIQPVKNYKTGEEKRRETKATIHFPLETTIIDIQGDAHTVKYFQSPFSNWIHFHSTIKNTNNTTNTIHINFTL